MSKNGFITVDNLKYLIENENLKLSENNIENILKQNNKNLVLYLLSKNLIPKLLTFQLYKFIIDNNHYDIIYKLDFNYFDINENASILLRRACEIGDINLVKFLVKNNIKLNIPIKEIRKLGCSPTYPYYEYCSIVIAASQGHYDIVDFLIKIAEKKYLYGNIVFVGLFLFIPILCMITLFTILFPTNVMPVLFIISLIKLFITFCIIVYLNSEEIILIDKLNYVNLNQIKLESILKSKNDKIIKFIINSDLEYFSNFYNIRKIVKEREMVEFYDAFNIKTPIDEEDEILLCIKNHDIESIKKYKNYDFSKNDGKLISAAFMFGNKEIRNFFNIEN